MNGTTRWPMERDMTLTAADVAEAARVRNVCDVLEPGVVDRGMVYAWHSDAYIMQAVLDAIRARPGISSRELPAACGLDKTQCWPAINNLKRRALVRAEVTHLGHFGCISHYWPMEVA